MPFEVKWHTDEERRAARAETQRKYRQSDKGRLATRRNDIDRKRAAGPAGSPGAIGAAAQRERISRPEYVLARRLGVSVKLAREMMEQ